MIYQLHFSKPIGDTTRPRMHAQHYVGFAVSERTMWSRIDHHRRGTSGVPIVKAAIEAGCELHVVMVREGTRDEERRMKSNGHHAERCYICQGAEPDAALEEGLRSGLCSTG